MKIVADENMPLVNELFAGVGEIVRIAGRHMSADDVRDADALLVRSVTQVNAALLAGSRVKFVGTATIGTDHLDLKWLAEQHIHVASAPGCNARAVAEYDMVALIELAQELNFLPQDKTVGVIGLGNVGSQVAALAQAMGYQTAGFDPFVEHAAVKQKPWAELVKSDILLLHTPMTRTGSAPTFHLLNEAVINGLSAQQIVLNAGRGAVIDNQALKQRLRLNDGLTAVLDVWEGEPALDADLLQLVRFGSPHIAGYSQEGKWRGTGMIHHAFCQYFGLQATHTWEDFVPENNLPATVIDKEQSFLSALVTAMRAAYPITRDDTALRAAQFSAVPAQAFDQLRKDYPARREFSAHRVSIQATHPAVAALKALGFQLQLTH